MILKNTEHKNVNNVFFLQLQLFIHIHQVSFTYEHDIE